MNMDITALYKSLSPDDRAIYQRIRTELRKVYLTAHTEVVGMIHWTTEDDYFLDLLDIKVAVLFDRAGAIEATKPIVDKEEEKAAESTVTTRDGSIMQKVASSARLLEAIGKDKW